MFIAVSISIERFQFNGGTGGLLVMKHILYCSESHLQELRDALNGSRHPAMVFLATRSPHSSSLVLLTPTFSPAMPGKREKYQRQASKTWFIY